MNSKKQQRTVFFVSDGTGLTAEAQGHTLLTQFPDIAFRRVTLPFVNSPLRADEALAKIAEADRADGARPIVFCTVIDEAVRERLKQTHALVFDLFESYISPMEEVLGTQASRVVGRSHGQVDTESYRLRIDAVNYAVANDDGVSTRHYDEADVVLIGVSRSGKTPLSLYLAMQYGVYAANYPLAEHDLDDLHLPAALEKYRSRLFGLLIDPLRLQQIRHQRRPNSPYSSVQQCQYEVRQVAALYRKERIAFIDSTTRSIEEMASELLQVMGLPRRL
jgi:regulator of PEP synthase PpsR (kinase-PPPase family)